MLAPRYTVREDRILWECDKCDARIVGRGFTDAQRGRLRALISSHMATSHKGARRDPT